MKFKRDKMGIPGAWFADRWLVDFGPFSLRLHHWTGSDDPEAYHDHAGWFAVFVLAGGYRDVTPEGEEVLRPGSLRFRRAGHMHTVQNMSAHTWTLCLFGPQTRRWSFLDFKGKKRRRDKYFAEVGHHTETGERVRLRPDGSRI